LKIQFTKMSGAGNDFVVIDNRSGIVNDGATLARKLCNRRWGIGADGLLLLEPSVDADFKMMYYNADGSYGGMCGNGGRCISRFAVDNGIAGNTQNFEALGYLYGSKVSANEVILSMKNPTDLKMNIVLRAGTARLNVHYINTGSPHVVVPTAQLSRKYGSLKEIPVDKLGQRIRYDRHFAPAGTNVNFIEKGEGNSIKIRTYERGVETETLACGTGSIASAIVGSRLWKKESPIVILPAGGVPLKVAFKHEGSSYADITLTGQAVTTFRGEVEV